MKTLTTTQAAALKAIKRSKVTVSAEDPNTVYVSIFGRRLIFKNGKYDGWMKL